MDRLAPEHRTLAELEGRTPGRVSDDDPYYMRAIDALLDKPLKDFSVEDLRITIGQDVGLVHLMPLALAQLEENPLAEGMHYPGDLLCSVLGASRQYYREHQQEVERLVAIVARVPAVARGLDEADFECLSNALEEALPGFQK